LGHFSFGLVYFFLKAHSQSDLILEINLGRTEFLIGQLEFLIVVIVYRLKLLVKLLDPLVQVVDFYNSCLKFLDESFLDFSSLFGRFGNLRDLFRLFLVIFIKLLIMFSELTESFTGSRFNLEGVELLESVGLVHTFNDGVTVSHQFFAENLSVFGKHLKGKKQLASLRGYLRIFLRAKPAAAVHG
jgi:hypothetical protein